jgi:hypothetical protein
MSCKGCAERREVIMKKMTAFAEWVKNPVGRPPVELVGSPPPEAPMIVPPTPADPNKLKRS